MSIFTGDEQIQNPDNVILKSPVPEMDGAFVEQKGLVKGVKPSIDYNMDMFQSTQGNADSIYDYLDPSDKNLDYIDMIESRATELKDINEKKYTGLMPKLFQSLKHPGNIIQRVTTKAIPEALVEGAMNTETYRRTLSIMQTAGENPDIAADILSSDTMINYLKGQADYLDNSMYEMYRNSDYRYLLNSAGMTGGVAVSTFLGMLAGTAIATGGVLVGLAAASAGTAAAVVGAGTLLYAGYKKLFDKDPYDDKAIGYNKDTQAIIDEFGQEEGLRIVTSKNLRNITSILEKIKKLDTNKSTYKQRRKEMLNKVNILANDISETTNEFSGTSFGAINKNAEIISTLQNAGYATANLKDLSVRKSNEENKSKDIKDQFGVSGNNLEILKGFNSSKAKAEKVVLEKYFGGNKESFLGEKLKNPEKIKSLIDETIPKFIDKEINDANNEYQVPMNVITSNVENGIFKDKQANTVINLKSKLEQHIRDKAQGLAESIALKNLENIYHQRSRDNATPIPLSDFIKNNMESAKKAVMPYAIGFTKNIVDKDIANGDFVLPDGTNTQYLKTKPGTPKQSTYGLTLEDENLVSEVNDELYEITNENTLRDYLGEPRAKQLDPIYKTPKYMRIKSNVLSDLQKYRTIAIDTFKRNHNFLQPETEEQMIQAEKEASIPEQYRSGNKPIDDRLAIKVMSKMFDKNDFFGDDDPFRKIEHIHETFSTMAPLSDDALDVVKKHLIRSFTANKVKEEEMINSDDFDYKINLVQQKRYKDLITINWIDDLKYLRKAYYSGDFSEENEIFGEDEMPTYWGSRYESWKEDFLLGKIFAIRRTGSFAGRADIAASDILEIQKLESIRKAFINKYGEDNKAVKFIEEREKFYHNAIQHSAMATMLGKELYDRSPMFATIIAEAPYDIMQIAASGAITKGLMSGATGIQKGLSNISGKASYKGQLGFNILKNFINDPSNKHVGTATGPIFRLAKHALGDTIEMGGIMSKINSNAMIKAQADKILRSGGPEAAANFKKFINSTFRKDIGKETASKATKYLSSLLKQVKKKVPLTSKFLNDEKRIVVEKILESTSKNLDTWSGQRHWSEHTTWLKKLLGRDPENASTVTQNILSELRGLSETVTNHIGSSEMSEGTIVKLADDFTDIIARLGTVPADASSISRIFNKVSRLVLRKQKTNSMNYLYEITENAMKNQADQLGVTRMKIYEDVFKQTSDLEALNASYDAVIKEVSDMNKNLQGYINSKTVKNLDEVQRKAYDLSNHIVLEKNAMSYLDTNEGAIKYYNKLQDDDDKILKLWTLLKKEIPESFEKIKNLNKTTMDEKKALALKNVYKSLRIQLSGADGGGNIPKMIDEAYDVFGKDSKDSIPKLFNMIYSVIQEDNANASMIRKYNHLMDLGLNIKSKEFTKLSKQQIKLLRNFSETDKLNVNDGIELEHAVKLIRKAMSKFNHDALLKNYTAEQVESIQKGLNLNTLWKNGKDYLNDQDMVIKEVGRNAYDAIQEAFEGIHIDSSSKRDLIKMLTQSAEIPMKFKYLYDPLTPAGKGHNYEGVLHILSSLSLDNTDSTSGLVNTIDKLKHFTNKVGSNAIKKASADFERDILKMIKRSSILGKLDKDSVQKIWLKNMFKADTVEQAKEFNEANITAFRKYLVDNEDIALDSSDIVTKHISKEAIVDDDAFKKASDIVNKYERTKLQIIHLEDMDTILNDPTKYNALQAQIVEAIIEDGEFVPKHVGRIMYGFDTDLYTSIERNYVEKVQVGNITRMQPDYIVDIPNVDVVTASALHNGEVLINPNSKFSKSAIVKALSKKFKQDKTHTLYYVNTKAFSSEQLEGLISGINARGFSYTSKGIDDSGILFVSNKSLGKNTLDDVVNKIFHGLSAEETKKFIYYDKDTKRLSKIFSDFNQLDPEGLKKSLSKKMYSDFSDSLQKATKIIKRKNFNRYLKALGISRQEKQTDKQYDKFIAKRFTDAKNGKKALFNEKHLLDLRAVPYDPKMTDVEYMSLMKFIDSVEDHIIMGETNGKPFKFLINNNKSIRSVALKEESFIDFLRNDYIKADKNISESDIQKLVEHIASQNAEFDGAAFQTRQYYLFTKAGKLKNTSGTNKTQIISPYMFTKENSATLLKEHEDIFNAYFKKMNIKANGKVINLTDGDIGNIYFEKSFMDTSIVDPKNSKKIIKSYSYYSPEDFAVTENIQKARVRAAKRFDSKHYMITENAIDDYYYLPNLQTVAAEKATGPVREVSGIIGSTLALKQFGEVRNGVFQTPLKRMFSAQDLDDIRMSRKAGNIFTNEFELNENSLFSLEMEETAAQKSDELYVGSVAWFNKFLKTAADPDLMPGLKSALNKQKGELSPASIYSEYMSYIKNRIRLAGNNTKDRIDVFNSLNGQMKAIIKKFDGTDMFNRMTSETSLPADDVYTFMNKMSELINPMNHSHISTENGLLMFDHKVLSRGTANTLINTAMSNSMKESGQYLTIVPDMNMLGGKAPLKDFEVILPPSYKGLGFNIGDDLVMSVFPTESASRLARVTIKGFSPYEGTVAMNGTTARRLARDFDGDGARVFYRRVNKGINTYDNAWDKEIIDLIDNTHNNPGFNFMSENNFKRAIDKFKTKDISGTSFTKLATKILKQKDENINYQQAMKDEITNAWKGDKESALKDYANLNGFIDTDNNAEWKTFLEILKDGYKKQEFVDPVAGMSKLEKNVYSRSLVGAVDNDSEGVFTLIDLLKKFSYDDDGHRVMDKEIKTFINNQLAKIGIDEFGYAPYGGPLEFIESLVAPALQSSIDSMNGGVGGNPINLRFLMALKRSKLKGKFPPVLGQIKPSTPISTKKYINPARQLKNMLVEVLREYDGPRSKIDGSLIKGSEKNIFKNILYYTDTFDDTQPTSILNPIYKDFTKSYNKAWKIKERQNAYKELHRRIVNDGHTHNYIGPTKFKYLNYVDNLIDDIPLDDPLLAKTYGFAAQDPGYHTYSKFIDNVIHRTQYIQKHITDAPYTPSEALSIQISNMNDVDEGPLYRMASQYKEKKRVGKNIYEHIRTTLNRDLEYTADDVADLNRPFSKIGREDITADYIDSAPDIVKATFSINDTGGEVLAIRENAVLSTSEKSVKQRVKMFTMINDFLEMAEIADTPFDKKRYYTMAGESLSDMQAVFKNITEKIQRNSIAGLINATTDRSKRITNLFGRTYKVGEQYKLFNDFIERLNDTTLNKTSFNLTREIIQPLIESQETNIKKLNPKYIDYFYDGFRNHETLDDIVSPIQYALTDNPRAKATVRGMIKNNEIKTKDIRYLFETEMIERVPTKGYIIDQMPASDYWRQMAHKKNPKYIEKYMQIEQRAMETYPAMPITADRNNLRLLANITSDNETIPMNGYADDIIRMEEQHIVKTAQNEMDGLYNRAFNIDTADLSLKGDKSKLLDDDMYGTIKKTTDELNTLLDPAVKDIQNKISTMIGSKVGEGVTSNVNHAIAKFISLYKAFKLSLPGGGLRFVVFNGIENTYKSLLHMVDNVNDGYQLKASSLLDLNKHKGNANEIISNLMFFDDLGMGFNKSDPNLMWRTLEGSRTINLYNKMSSATEHMFSKSTDKWYGKLLDNVFKLNSRYLQWTGDNFETPFRNKVFSDKFMQEFVRATTNGFDPNVALQKAAKIAWKTTDEIFFDYSNKIGAFSGANQILYPFGDFRFKNANYWANQFANNPLLLRGIMHTLPHTRNSGIDPRQNKMRIPATDLYINPFSLLSFNDFMRHTIAKPAFTVRQQKKYEKLYEKIKGLPEEQQRAFAFRQKDGPEVMAYFQYRHVKPFAQMFRLLDDYLGMSSMAKGTANTLAGMAFNGRMFKPDDYKGEWGALLELSNAWWPGKDVNQPIALMKLLSPKHSNYLKKQSAKKIKSAMKTMNMSEEEAKRYIISIERHRQLLAFLTGLFPTVVTNESANYINMISSWKKGVKPYANDTNDLQEYLLNANLPDTSAYRLFDSTKHAIENAETYSDKMELIPVMDMGKLAYIPVVNLKEDAVDTVIMHMAAAGNPFYLNDYKNVIETPRLEKIQYVEYGINSSKYLKDELKEEYFHRRGLSNTNLHKLYKKYFTKNKYESLRTTREYLRSQSGGVPYNMLNDDAAEDMQYVDRLESRIKNWNGVTPSMMDGLKKDFPNWVYDYAAKRYVSGNWNNIDWTEPDRHAVKGIIEMFGKKNYLRLAAGYSLSKDHGKEIKDLATFNDEKDINATAFSPSKMSQINPILRKKFKAFIPELPIWAESGKKYYDGIIKQSGLETTKLKQNKVQIPRQLESFAFNPSRKMIRKLSNTSMAWIQEHGFTEAFQDSMETGNMTFLQQAIQKYLKFRNYQKR